MASCRGARVRVGGGMAVTDLGFSSTQKEKEKKGTQPAGGLGVEEEEEEVVWRMALAVGTGLRADTT